MRVGIVSLASHFLLPLITSIMVARVAPEPLDWLVLAAWVSIFALYQYLIDYIILRDKLPTTEYWEFSLYLVTYSVLNMLGIV